MNIKLFDDLTEFAEKTRPFLEKDEARHNLIMGVVTSLQRQPRRRRHRPILGVIESKNEIKLIGVMTPPRKMILTGYEADIAAVKPFVDCLKAKNKKVPAVFGPATLATAFADLWLVEAERPYRQAAHQAIYQITAVNNLSLPKGALRNPYPEELDLITDWIFGFHRDAHTDQSPSLATQVAGQLMQNRDLFVWADDDDQPKSMAAKSRPTKNGVAVNMVYTPPEERGKGYATACVAQLSQRLLDDGYQFCTLFTDLNNLVSNHTYQKIGYTLLLEFLDLYWDEV